MELKWIKGSISLYFERLETHMILQIKYKWEHIIRVFHSLAWNVSWSIKSEMCNNYIEMKYAYSIQHICDFSLTNVKHFTNVRYNNKCRSKT